MANGKKKQIYIPKEDFDILEHLQDQPNQSQYIIRLVRDDMKKPSGASWEAIMRILEKEKTPGHNNMPKEL